MSPDCGMALVRVPELHLHVEVMVVINVLDLAVAVVGSPATSVERPPMRVVLS